MQVLLVLSACLAAASAQDSLLDYFVCPEVNVTQNFDLSAFSGVWYQQNYSLGSSFTQGYSTCGVSNWTQVNSTTLHMVNTQKGLLGISQSVEGYGVLEDVNIGNFTTTFSSLFGDMTTQLKVLSTDYENYAITYSCADFLAIPLHAAWITTRVQNPTGDVKTELDALIQAAIDSVEGLYNSDFISTSQENCS